MVDATSDVVAVEDDTTDVDPVEVDGDGVEEVSVELTVCIEDVTTCNVVVAVVAVLEDETTGMSFVATFVCEELTVVEVVDDASVSFSDTSNIIWLAHVTF